MDNSRLFDFLDLKVRQEFVGTMPSEAVCESAASVYFKSAALETALSYISGAIVKSEVKTYAKNAEEKGTLYRLLNCSPNPNQNASEFWTKLVYTLMLDGECLVVKIRDGLYVADSFSVDKKWLLKNVYQGVSVEGEQLARKFRADKVIHLSSGNTQLSALIKGLWLEYGDLIHYAVDGFKRGSGSKYKLTIDAAQAGTRKYAEQDEADRQDPTGTLATFMSKANSTYIQHRGVDLQQLGTSGCESGAVTAMRKEIFETVATICHIPPPLIFGTMTNIRDLNQAFLTYAVDPIAKQISDEFSVKCYTEDEWASGSYVQVDTSRISHVDIFEKSSNISQLIGAGFSLDEIRAATGWPRINTPESQEHLITRNYAPIDDLLREISGGGEIDA